MRLNTNNDHQKLKYWVLDNMTSYVVKQYSIYGWCHPVQEIDTHEFPTMSKCTTQDYTTNKIVPTTLLPTIKKGVHPILNQTKRRQQQKITHLPTAP